MYIVLYTMCPISSDPFYIVTYYMKRGSLLLGHTVYYLRVTYFSSSYSRNLSLFSQRQSSIILIDKRQKSVRPLTIESIFLNGSDIQN